jgi:hypothetical protein
MPSTYVVPNGQHLDDENLVYCDAPFALVPAKVAIPQGDSHR